MKKALTLPEMIILLGVIGIIAIMLLTNLMKNHQKKVFALRLNQAYSTLNNAIKMAEAEENILTSMSKDDYINSSLSENDQNGLFAEYFLPYMNNVTKLTTTWKTYTPAGKNADFASMKNPYCANNAICYKLIQSAGYNQDTDETFLDYTYIIIDVNGQTGPNKVGCDTYYFNLKIDSQGPKIECIPHGISASITIDELYKLGCNKTNSDWTNGNTCSEIVKRNNWKIPKDSRYPW
ncbi:MAG: hypothetical protein E7Z87_05085 [Cyanobacteria bacterium SIG26]|nr:hypothetical protein [Cyanobacteria bacterium SIG26]